MLPREVEFALKEQVSQGLDAALYKNLLYSCFLEFNDIITRHWLFGPDDKKFAFKILPEFNVFPRIIIN